MISKSKLNANGKAKCFVSGSPKDPEGTALEEVAGALQHAHKGVSLTKVRPCVCQKSAVTYKVTVPRGYLEIDREKISLTTRQSLCFQICAEFGRLIQTAVADAWVSCQGVQ